METTEQPTCSLRWVSAALYDSHDQSFPSQFSGRMTLQQLWIIYHINEDRVCTSCEEEWRNIPVFEPPKPRAQEGD